MYERETQTHRMKTNTWAYTYICQVYMGKPKDSLLQLVLSFHHAHPGGWARSSGSATIPTEPSHWPWAYSLNVVWVYDGWDCSLPYVFYCGWELKSVILCINKLRLTDDACLQMVLHSLQSPASRLPFGSHTGQHGGLWGQQDRWHAWQECASGSLLGSLPLLFSFIFSTEGLWLWVKSHRTFALPQCFKIYFLSFWPPSWDMFRAVSPVLEKDSFECWKMWLLLGFSVMFCRVSFRIIFLGCIMRPKCLCKSASSPDDGRSLCFTSYAQSLSYQRKQCL